MQKKVSFFAFLFVLFACLFSIGCASEPKVDTSNDQAFVNSITEIYKALPETERADFGKYFMATIAGEITTFGFKNIKEDEYGKLYSMVKLSGEEKAAKYLNAVNGMTATQIQEKGKGIWKSYWGKKLMQLNEQAAKLEASAQEFSKYAEEQAKVVVEIGEELELAPSTISRSEHMLGSVTVPISIHNGGTLRLIQFRSDTLIVKDEDGKIADTPSASFYNFTSENGSKPFQKGFRSEGVAPGETIKGKIVMKISFISDTFLYPPAKRIAVTYKEGPLEPILEGHDQLYNNREAASRLEGVKKEVEEIEAELAKLAK